MALSILDISSTTNGKSLLISGTNSAGANTVHTSVSGTSQWDRIWLYMHNMETASVVATVEWGETSNPITQTISSQDGWVLVIPGLLLQNGLTVKAFASVANKVIVNAVIQQGP